MLEFIRKPLLAAVLIPAMTSLPVGVALAQATSPSQIVGIWEAEDGNVKFEMFDAGGSYAARSIYGVRLVEADGKTFKKDTHNPDPKLRDRSLKGIVFITNLAWDARDRRWEGGNMYDPSSGRSLSARVSLVGGKMELRAYMGTPMLGRTMVLRRAQ
ncbi:DUF2147 domain-containing protein [Sphingobium yanoikuyae]|jgi:uncharacterized protein (DUF2147 family)|uniref:DUF2147 domain-containing protein n=1 Tax=Sphingobium yanoikuyae TaxID=13690 RepID=UPI0035C79AC9